MNKDQVPHSKRHLERYGSIARVIYKYGFTDLALSLAGKKNLEISEKELSGLKTSEAAMEVRFREALEELGPSFVKLGQLLSNRPDILPMHYILELEKLQDNAQPFPAEKAKEIIKEELNRPPEEIFHYFEEEPFAAASLSQVHKAILKSGEPVAVKIQRPDITTPVEADIEIMEYIAVLLHERNENMKYMNPKGLVRTFKDSILKEMDYQFEALNIERFRKNFKGDTKVKVPVVFKDFSTSRVLTMEFLDGVKVNNTAALSSLGIDPKKVADAGTEAFFKQVFEHGFFHADPHAGNMVVQTDGRIAYMDFGMMGVLLPEVKEQVTALFIGIDTQDTQRIIRALKNLSRTHRFEDEEELRYKISELVEYYSITSLGSLSFADLLNSFRELLIAYRIKIPSEMFLLIKALSITENLGKTLDPEMNVVKKLRPHIKRLIRKKLTPSGLSRSFYLAAIDTASFIKDLPGDLKDIIDKVRYGNLHVEIEHKGLDDFGDQLIQVSNRIAFAILTASLVIGSSLLIHSGVPPVYNGVPIPGVIGFVISGFLAFRLLIGIWRKGKL